MGIQKSFLRHIAVAFLAANIIAQVQCLPKGKVDELRRQEMERIRANILTRLGLTGLLDSGEPLTVDEEAVVAAFREYQMAKEERRVHAEDNSVKLTFVGQLHKQGTVSASASNGQLDGYSILFELKNATIHTITKAELLLFQAPHQHVPYLHIKVKAATNGPSLIVNTNYDELEQPGYKTFDITPIIAIWLKGGSSGPLVLEVSAHCTDTPDCGKHIFDGGFGEKSPKLIVSREVEENTLQQRLKRQVDTPDDESSGFDETLVEESNETCSLHPLSINFKDDLGFDHIYEPKSFIANYCLGTCSYDEVPAVYYYYHLLATNSPASSIQPHCIPRTYRSLDVLSMYPRGEGQTLFVIERLADVIVTSCGCA